MRCSDVFQSQLPASEDMQRGGRGWREALPYLDKWTPPVSLSLFSSSTSLCSESEEGLIQSISASGPLAPHNRKTMSLWSWIHSIIHKLNEGIKSFLPFPSCSTLIIYFSGNVSILREVIPLCSKIENMLIIISMNIQFRSYYSI